jgi:hypothetical protein
MDVTKRFVLICRQFVLTTRALLTAFTVAVGILPLCGHLGSVSAPDVTSVAAETSGSSATGTIYFDDSDPDIMVVGNASYYEAGFRKSNGAIAYITDKATGQHVSLGSRYECLWGAVFPAGAPQYVGGCSYNVASANQFTYAWSATAQTLTLNYIPDPAASQRVTAQVTMTATEDSSLDLHLQIQNNWGYALDYVLFPSDLVFAEPDIQEALLPILPGVALGSAFFDQHRSYAASYPGYPGLFADYLSLSSTKGRMAVYSLYDGGPIHPVVIGFIHDDAYISQSTFAYHTFGARIADGDAWSSPTVRVRISEPAVEAINAYRIDNGLDGFASLRSKLGLRYSQIAQSPLLKADAQQLGVPFSQYGPLLSQVPSPAILHPVAFQPGGHDESYPDFLPPDTAWGTTADLAAMFEQAQGLGLLVMPYTNPTWWDDGSPTLQNLPPPLTITDVAVLNDQHVPIYEYYGSHGGYVMSPYAPFVQQRLDQLVAQMTVDVPSDMLFEDQIGARPWLFDHNPSSPYPTAYIQGWLDHTSAHSGTLLMTELGFDRLADSEVGFHGSVLLPQRSGDTSTWWGTDTWRPYPLAPLMARDKTLFYQHDLAPETMTVDKPTLTWNMAFGYMLSYDLVTGGLESPWLSVVADFQKHVVAAYADERAVAFANLSDDVTQTSFEAFTVTANWDEASPYDIGEHTVSPLGFVAVNFDRSLTAGIFVRYNDKPLAAGDHYLIEERNLADIIVHQPLGADTSLTLKRLPAWRLSDMIEAWAHARSGELLGSVPVTVTGEDITFTYQQEVAGRSVAYYVVQSDQPVGGIAELPEVENSALRTGDDNSSPNPVMLAGLGGSGVLVVASAWYARRRRLRRRA